MKPDGHQMAIQRKRAILSYIAEKGLCTIDDISDRFSVSRVTVHRVLTELQNEHQVTKVRGGVEHNRANALQVDFDKRLRQCAEEKAQVARKGFDLIAEESTIFLDASTTCLALAGEIAARMKHRLSVVTNAPMVVQQLCRLQHIKTIDTGGEVIVELNALAGPITVDVLKRLNFDTAFFSIGAVSLENGLMTAHTALVDVLHSAMHSARRKILLVDSTKFERVAPLTVAPVSDLSCIVTDSRLPDSTRQALLAHGVDVR